ncbi:class I SAM-dependent methyltransferase [uncultured Croceitalea sp.]|uniref:class I SAM-dependent methyltransferase n=1 Tax=uncultured Croceitalea sp. TaxID=1798908 RepID=UPI003305ABAB
MNKNILKTGVQEFIKNNCNADIVSVLLKKQQFNGVSQKELVEQLEAKKKSQNKLPTWFATEQIYYPNKLNIEQTSSEITAQYKADLVSGKSLIDITGGLGIDSYFFAKKIAQIIHCELDQKLSKITSYNAKILDTKNIKFEAQNGIDFLKNSDTKFDWIYADPSRRNEAKEKVFLLKDCLPNIPLELDTLFHKADNILIKTSPLLDIAQGISELKFVKEIHVVAVKNEVKELLWILEKSFEGELKVKTVNLQKEAKQIFDFILSEEKTTTSELGTPGNYLYEPNAAILKSGGFKTISATFGLTKFHEHSHLYSLDKLIDFPGRIFHIQETLPYNKKTMVQFKGSKVNVTTRNFSETVATLRKKYKLKDGGDTYLFFTRDLNSNLIVIRCTKIYKV